VICERDVPDTDWKQALTQLAELADSPLLIVTSRWADDYLWAEVLNLGGYDVLMKPFDQTEVVRVISLAWLNWKNNHDRRAGMTRPCSLTPLECSVVSPGPPREDERVKRIGAILCCAALAAISAAAELQKATLEAFQGYVRATEARLDGMRSPGHFLWADQSPGAAAAASRGADPHSALERQGRPGGARRPHPRLDGRRVRTGRNARAHTRLGSGLRSAQRVVPAGGRRFPGSQPPRQRLQDLHAPSQKKAITVVLDTEHEVHYFPVDSKRWYSRSYSTRIQEVDDPGTPEERLLPAGDDHGFLWRLYSYWRFEERDGGVYLECQALSLTRDVPTGLGWLIEPIIRQLPRESLANTLRSTATPSCFKAAPAR